MSILVILYVLLHGIKFVIHETKQPTLCPKIVHLGGRRADCKHTEKPQN